MRVLAVAHVLNLGDLYVDGLAPGARFLVRGEEKKSVRGDAMVGGGMGEGFKKGRKVSCGGWRAPFLSVFGKDRAIALWTADPPDFLIFFPPRPHHSGPADV